MQGYTKITKAQFYNHGGMSNPRFFRVTRKGEWAYFSRDN